MKTTAPALKTYPVHPAANLIPEPSKADYERLKADIKQHGLKVPIVLTPDGQILDGRTREKICRELGIDFGGWLTSAGANGTRTASFEEILDPTALVLSLNSARRHLTADQIAALYLSRPRVERPGEAPSRSPRGEGKTSEKIAKKIGVSRAVVERVQRIQKKFPDRMADVASGRVNGKRLLKGVEKGIWMGHLKEDGTPKTMKEQTGRTVVSWRSEKLLAAVKNFTRTIKEAVEKREPVSIEQYDAIEKSLKKIHDVLDQVAPRWQCEECDHVLDENDYLDEPEPRYECGECGENLTETRCEQCNTFASKILDHGCIDKECEGEMRRVGWETVVDQLAKQAKESEAEEAARLKKQKEEEAFAKTPAGKKEAKEEADRKAERDAAREKDHEDDILERADQITRARAAGITVAEQQRLDRREAEVTRIIRQYVENDPTDGEVHSGPSRTYWDAEVIPRWSKEEKARLAAALAKGPEEAPADLIRTKPTWTCCEPQRGWWHGKVEHWTHGEPCSVTESAA